MKRLAAVVVGLLLAVSGMQTAVPTAQAQEVGITLSVAEAGTGLADVQADAGQQAVMRITAAGTENMAGIQLDLSYDSTVLGVDSVVQVDVLSGFFFQVNATQPGVIKIAMASATASGVGQIDIADITFDLIGGPDDSTTLTFSGGRTGDGSIPSSPIPVTVVDGSITISIAIRPLAADDAYETDEEATLTVAAPGVLANDTGEAPLAALLSGDVSNGSLTLNGDGSFTYAPNTGFTGDDSFTYVANDGSADSDVATVTITVNALPAPAEPEEAPAPSPTREPTPLPPLTVVPESEITPVDPDGGLVVIVHPTAATEAGLEGVSLRLAAPSLATTFQLRLKLLDAASLEVQPLGRALRTVQIDLFDVEGDPLLGVSFFFAAALTVTLSDREVQELGGLTAMLDEVLAGRLSIQRFRPSSGEWDSMLTTHDFSRRTFTAFLSGFSTFALVWTGAPAPTLTPEASPTPAPAPEATQTPSPTVQATPTATPLAETDATPTPTTTPTPTPTPTSTPVPQAGATATPTAPSTPVPATATPTPVPAAVAATATPTPTSTAAPSPVPTATPTAEPLPTLEAPPEPTPAAFPLADEGGGMSGGMLVLIIVLGSVGGFIAVAAGIVVASRRRAA